MDTLPPIELPPLSREQEAEAAVLSRAMAEVLSPLLQGHNFAVIYEATTVAFCGALAATWDEPAQRDQMFEAYVQRARGIFATVDKMGIWNGR
jgi:hypothetical protein